MSRVARLAPLLLLVAAAPVLSAARATDPAPDLLLILDASGSMWGQIEGENKIVIARRVLRQLLDELPDGSEIGLVAYGHRREGDCADVETLAPVGPADKDALAWTIDSLSPKGKTPITASVKQAFATVKDRPGPTSIILVSDGLETCGGDPCQAVREAKAAGIQFVMHVVGFDVSTEDVSSLECAAQAGEGLYFGADDAGELASALEQAAAARLEVPGGRLSVAAMADGELTDAAVWVTNLATGEEVAAGRTYVSPDTNPRVLALQRGTYRVEAQAVGLRGDVRRTWEEIEIAEDGEPVELVADFSAGDLVLGVTRNGALSDATIRVYPAGGTRQVAGGRTYTSASSNPLTIRLTAGTYDVELGSVEMKGDSEHRFGGVEVTPGGRVELAHEFVSGTLKVKAVREGELVDATVNVRPEAGGQGVAGGRTYADPKNNLKLFELSPGAYVVEGRGVRMEGAPRREAQVTVVAGETVELVLDFGG